jgi:hypothetical protein
MSPERSYRSTLRALVGLAAASVACLSPSAARAETRTYLDVNLGVHPRTSEYQAPQLRIFAREENRFRSQGLVLNKAFIGPQVLATPWLQFDLYYAKKDMFYAAHKSKHMATFDMLLKAKLGPLRGKDRMGSEWHVTDQFYRFRNYTELGYVTPIKWLSLWTAEEFRYDADAQRINVNDNRFGLGLQATSTLRLRPFVDIENTRRGKPSWHRLMFLGFFVGASI